MKITTLCLLGAVSAQAIFKTTTPSSLLDQLYGEIVDITPNYEITSNALPLSKVLAMRSKLALPDKDDTSDIAVDQNMFGGILTYAHFPHFNCFVNQSSNPALDIAIVGAPFDTGTSYRPGSRFGPEAIRSNARRLGSPWKSGGRKRRDYPADPYDETTHNYSIVDCGDVAMTPFDNRIALNQLYRGHRSISKHTGVVNTIPKIITLGGDHTITLMAIRNAHERLGDKIRVLHFDSHIDTWDPKKLGGGITDYMSLNHGTFLHYAHELGYISADGNYHVGIRAPYIDAKYDEQHDAECGFSVISAGDIDRIGVSGIVRELTRDPETPTYISVDIDVLDPAYAPGTGTMEVGGFTTRELLSVLEGLRRKVNLIGADVVEVSPPFDTNSEITSLAATSVVDAFLKLMVV
ncbi:putative agmatinase 1 [Candida viswanathii]|uniref:Putative agmatinase 1 n=1 Tax=Candida viswanathii TaxID=5486 RepID=A0A367XVS3_9ASCO|nr:putative agmatinase 1 [Candida viswanathii]RCK58064.1 putative agmatinase 1 [Candida viswanathii]